MYCSSAVDSCQSNAVKQFETVGDSIIFDRRENDICATLSVATMCNAVQQLGCRALTEHSSVVFGQFLECVHSFTSCFEMVKQVSIHSQPQ